MKNKTLRYLLGFALTLLILSVSKLSFAAEKLPVTATASSIYYYRYVAANAVDGNRGTYWVGGLRQAPWWLMLDIGKMANIEEIRLCWLYSYYPVSFDIQVSEDGENWEDAHTGLAGEYTVPSAPLKSYMLSKQGRYVRIYIHIGRSIFPVIPEIEVYGDYNVRQKYIPGKIRFQGELKDNNGLAAEGTHSITFNIYKEETGGLPLWSETQEGVEVKNGMLDVVLGSVNEIKLPFDEQYYLALDVENDGEMSPRFEMTTAPYAFRASE